MNSLSWLLYLADISSNVQQTAIGFIIFGGMAAIGATMWYMLENDLRALKLMRILWPLIFLCAVMATLAPSRNTVLMIAASEGAEMVVTSPDGKEIIADTLAVIKKELKERIND